MHTPATFVLSNIFEIPHTVLDINGTAAQITTENLPEVSSCNQQHIFEHFNSKVKNGLLNCI